MRIGRLLILAVCVAFPSSVAFAEYSYFGVQAGPVIRSDSDVSQAGFTFQTSYDAGYLLGVTAGRSFQTFRIEGELSYRSNDISEGSAFGVTIPMGGSVSSTALMVNGYYDIKTSSPVTPYVGAGIGLAQVSFNDWDIGGITVADDDDIVVAYQFGAGIAFNVNPTFILDIGYKYFATADPSFEDVTGSPFDAEYNSHNVVLGAKFKF